MEKGKIIIIIIAMSLIIGALYYFNNINKSLSEKLLKLGATNEDVSKMNTHFLKEWLKSAEFVIEQNGKITSDDYFMYPPEKVVGMTDPNDKTIRKLYSVLGGKQE